MELKIKKEAELKKKEENLRKNIFNGKDGEMTRKIDYNQKTVVFTKTTRDSWK